MDVEDLIAGYDARKPLYTEGDFVKRFAEIKAARATGVLGARRERAPDDWMIALLASGRVTDAEYFRLARLLEVDPAGLIHAEPAPKRSFVELLLAVWWAFARFVSSLRRP
ncbi:MAG TPA: hypothetical protein VH722_17295 [Alphaproteobacteria bacterium]|nr:hypothetical protein [Alphaproteobacteria bacterium]